MCNRNVLGEDMKGAWFKVYFTMRSGSQGNVLVKAEIPKDLDAITKVLKREFDILNVTKIIEFKRLSDEQLIRLTE